MARTSDPAPRNVVDLGGGFWNIRGSFKVGGLVEVGTHASLVRLTSGGYTFLDAYSLDDATRRWVDALTGGGEAVEAILNVHPFHTIHVRAMHELYPRAKLYGTARHHQKLQDLPWEELRTEDAELHRRFADDFDFTVPRGVEFIPSNEHLHFSSVLVCHRASKTLHVDDTLTLVRLPGPLQALKRDVLRFHPTLSRVLERRPGAAKDFRSWSRQLIARARYLDNLCAAHSAVLRGTNGHDASIAARIDHALHKAERTLRLHERKYGS